MVLLQPPDVVGSNLVLELLDVLRTEDMVVACIVLEVARVPVKVLPVPWPRWTIEPVEDAPHVRWRSDQRCARQTPLASRPVLLQDLGTLCLPVLGVVHLVCYDVVPLDPCVVWVQSELIPVHQSDAPFQGSPWHNPHRLFWTHEAKPMLPD